MNEVYLRGKLVSVYESAGSTNQPKHLVYQLRVSHKTAQQLVKFENYTVNAWRNLAVWATANLRVGMDVVVRGYLSQRHLANGDVTEVTATTVTPVAPRPVAVKPEIVETINAKPKPEASAFPNADTQQDTP